MENSALILIGRTTTPPVQGKDLLRPVMYALAAAGVLLMGSQVDFRKTGQMTVNLVDKTTQVFAKGAKTALNDIDLLTTWNSTTASSARPLRPAATADVRHALAASERVAVVVTHPAVAKASAPQPEAVVKLVVVPKPKVKLESPKPARPPANPMPKDESLSNGDEVPVVARQEIKPTCTDALTDQPSTKVLKTFGQGSLTTVTGCKIEPGTALPGGERVLAIDPKAMTVTTTARQITFIDQEGGPRK